MSKPLRTFRQAFPILKYLAVNPNRTPYAIQEELKIERHTVLDSLKLLEKANLVTITNRKKLPTGLERKEYKTTPQGIVALLQAHPEHIKLSKSDMKKIASKNTQFLPAIFGKWETFLQMKVEDVAYEYLIGAVQHTEDEIERLNEVTRGQELKRSFATWEPMHRHDIYEAMLIRAPMFRTHEAEEWASIVRNDKELRAMAEKEIFRLQGEAKEGVKYWEGALKELHGEPHGEVSLVAGNPEDQDTWEKFDEWWKYTRAKALDEEKPLLTPSELVNQAVHEIAKEHDIRLSKKRKPKTKHRKS